MSKLSHPTLSGRDTTWGRRQAQATDKNTESTIGGRVTVMPNGCWAYQSRLDRYGKTDAREGTIIVHRFVYETLVGPIPDGHHLHHECENKGCCNPHHLVPLTPGDHTRRHAEMRRTA